MEAHYEWKGPQQPGPLRLFLNFRKSWRDSEMNGSLQLRIIEMVRANSVLSRREAVPAPLRGAYLHPGWDPPRKLPSGELRTANSNHTSSSPYPIAPSPNSASHRGVQNRRQLMSARLAWIVPSTRPPIVNVRLLVSRNTAVNRSPFQCP